MGETCIKRYIKRDKLYQKFKLTKNLFFYTGINIYLFQNTMLSWFRRGEERRGEERRGEESLKAQGWSILSWIFKILNSWSWYPQCWSKYPYVPISQTMHCMKTNISVPLMDNFCRNLKIENYIFKNMGFGHRRLISDIFMNSLMSFTIFSLNTNYY